MKAKTWSDLRDRYPRFIYESYELASGDDGLTITFKFSVPGLAEFTPRCVIPVAPERIKNKDAQMLHRLAFLLGMVELISYWKIACPPEVVVQAGKLNEAEVEFWRKLYFGGLGEFFYRNNCPADYDNFMYLHSVEVRENLPFFWTLSTYEAMNKLEEKNVREVLVPVGGGKDSAVSLAFLKAAGYRCHALAINANAAVLGTIEVAGLTEKTLISRQLDEKMLRLNEEGFLNGHTPFSAIVAFESLLAAYLYDIRDIALSNERSANEASIIGTKINHQYSKSGEFEREFQGYIEQQIGLPQRYFSLLRPLSEIAIAKHFAALAEFHPVFHSCNRGSKKGVWCGKCAKCLFVAIVLAPFIGAARVAELWGTDILNDEELLPELDELLGNTGCKPFECVGTIDEVKLALKLLAEQGDKSLAVRHFLGRTNGACDHSVYASSSYNNLLYTYIHDPELPVEYMKVLPVTYQIDRGTANKKIKTIVWENQPGEVTGTAANVSPVANRKSVAAGIDFRAPGHLVLGFGREGRAMLDFFIRVCPPDFAGRIGIANLTPLSEADMKYLQNLPFKVEVYVGKDYLSALAKYDICYKSPGISFKELTDSCLPTAKLPDYPNCRITCQADLFIRAFAAKIIGVTGTKGKSTTTSLIHSMLCRRGRAWLLGNIGRAPFTAIDEIASADDIALELSCHQLQYTSHSPHIAVLTNIYPEHLDHYRDYEEYIQAKFNILRYQKVSDWSILNGEQIDEMHKYLPQLPAKVILVLPNDVGAASNGEELNRELSARIDAYRKKCPGWNITALAFYDKPAKTAVRYMFLPSPEAGLNKFTVNLTGIIQALSGPAHACDLAMAITAVLITGLAVTEIKKGISDFAGLPHRCEAVKCSSKIKFFNDSISTIPETCILAMQTLEKVDALIIGGLDRGIDYSGLEKSILNSKLKLLLCLPDTGWQIADRLLAEAASLGIKLPKMVKVKTVPEAVRLAATELQAGDVCLFSPAAASYNTFKDFAERGDVFKQAVRLNADSANVK